MTSVWVADAPLLGASDWHEAWTGTAHCSLPRSLQNSEVLVQEWLLHVSLAGIVDHSEMILTSSAAWLVPGTGHKGKAGEMHGFFSKRAFKIMGSLLCILQRG